MPIRIYDLAKEVKRSNAEVVAMLEKEGFGTLSPSSNIDDVTAEKIRNNIKAALKAIKDAALAAAPTVPFNVTVQALGDQLGVGPAKILEVLVTFGITKASPTQRLSPDAATKIARRLGLFSAEVTQLPDSPPGPQKDGWSCGIWVLQFMEAKARLFRG